jgi:hypothetical protein
MRPRKSDTARVCPTCCAKILPGERYCLCLGREFRIPSKPAPEGSSEAAHYYHLFKSIRTKSWTKTGYKAPWSLFRFQLKGLHADMPANEKGNRGFEIRRVSRLKARVDDVAWFVFRCEVAHQYERNEFAGVIGSRLELWWAGIKKRQVCDFLGLSEAKLNWLDRFIRDNCVRFPARCHSPNPEILILRRRMKAGVAADIIRRHQHGYKQSQALPAQVDNPLTPVLDAHI